MKKRQSKARKLYQYHIKRYMNLTGYDHYTAQQFFLGKDADERRSKIKILKRITERTKFKKKYFIPLRKRWYCFDYKEIIDHAYPEED